MLRCKDRQINKLARCLRMQSRIIKRTIFQTSMRNQKAVREVDKTIVELEPADKEMWIKFSFQDNRLVEFILKLFIQDQAPRSKKQMKKKQIKKQPFQLIRRMDHNRVLLEKKSCKSQQRPFQGMCLHILLKYKTRQMQIILIIINQ